MTTNATQTALTATRVKSILQQVFGWILAAFFGLCVLVGSTQIRSSSEIGVLLFCIAVTAAGVLLIVAGVRSHRLIRLFRQYALCLAADPQKSIPALATAVGGSTQAVMKQLERMSRRGFFANAYIDRQRQCMVFVAVSPAATPADAAAGPVGSVVSCPGCGAANTLRPGVVNTCEFCGTPLSQ